MQRMYRICFVFLLFLFFTCLLVEAKDRFPKLPKQFLKGKKRKAKTPDFNPGGRVSAVKPIEVVNYSYGVLIGTQPYIDDVVTMDLYNTKTPKPFDPLLENANESATLGAEFASAVFHVGTVSTLYRNQLKLTKPFLDSSDPSILTATISGFEGILQPLPFILIGEKDQEAPLQLSINFQCVSSGTAQIKVFIRVVQANNDDRTQKIITFAFFKTCDMSKPVIGNTGGAFGFQIGTQPFTNNVVADGLPTVQYMHGGMDSPDDGHILTLDASKAAAKYYYSHRFFPVKMAKPVVYVHTPNILTLSLSGTASDETFTLEKDKSPELILNFHCLEEGSSLVSVATKWADGGATAFFTVKKVCSNAYKVEGVSVKGLRIGSFQGADDIVHDGFTMAEYRKAGSVVQGSSKRQVVAAGVKSFIIWAEMSAGSQPQAYSLPIVTAMSHDSAVEVAAPVLTGSVMDGNTLTTKAVQISVDFHCLAAGLVDVTVDIPLLPNGEISFTLLKRCAEPSESEKLAALPAMIPLPGLSMGASRSNLHNIMVDGIPNDMFLYSKPDDKLLQVTTKFDAFSLFLSFTPDANAEAIDTSNLILGRPSIVASLNVCEPELTGPGSMGGRQLETGMDVLQYTIEFNCVKEGNTPMTVSIPFVDKAGAASRPPLIIKFVKECGGMSAGGKNRGGVGIGGLSVGTTVFGNQIVADGYPTSQYFNQKNKAEPDWADAIVPAGNQTAVFYLSYRSDVAFRSNGMEAAESTESTDSSESTESSESSDEGENKTLSSVGDDDKSGNEDDLDFIDFQPPVIIRHKQFMKPTLGGDGMAGGRLLRNGAPIELSVTFNCQYAGVGAATIQIPIRPHGVISFTVPKQCDGKVVATGVHVADLRIGTEPYTQDVVVNGFTALPYTASTGKAKGQRASVREDVESTTFYIQGRKEWWLNPVKALEPMVISSHPIANPTLTHNLEHIADAKVNNTVSSDSAGGISERKWDESVEIVLGAGSQHIVVTYNCLWAGVTPIHLIIPLLPKGSISWTWTKVCPGNNLAWEEGEEGEEGEEVEDNGVMGEDSEQTSEESEGEAMIVDDDNKFENWEEVNPTDPHVVFDDEEDHDLTTAGLTGAGYVDVGTSETNLNDVVSQGVVNSKYSTQERTSSDHTVIRADLETMDFFISLPASFSASAHQSYGLPHVITGSSKDPIAKPALWGPASLGGIASTNPESMQLRFNCVEGKTGIIPMLISVPLKPMGSLSFRVVKICGVFEAKQGFFITAPRLFSLVLGVAILVGAFFFARKMKDKRLDYKAVSTKDGEFGLDGEENDTAVSY